MGWTHFVMLSWQWETVYRRFIKKLPRSVGQVLYQNQPSYFNASTVYLRHFPLVKKCLKKALLLLVWTNKKIDASNPCRNFSAKGKKPQHLRGRKNRNQTLGLHSWREIPIPRGHISLPRVLWSSGMDRITRFADCWQDNSTWIFNSPWLIVTLRNQCHRTCFSRALITQMSDNQGTEAWV